MDLFSLLESDDSLRLVDNRQQQEMVSLFCNMNYVLSTSVEELDIDYKRFYQHVHENILIKMKNHNIFQNQIIRYLHL